MAQSNGYSKLTALTSIYIEKTRRPCIQREVWHIWQRQATNDGRVYNFQPNTSLVPQNAVSFVYKLKESFIP
jgi:hypothetical protein